jgi:saccharopine dehydrogenase-like NADP-dependent oxidoreductase
MKKVLILGAGMVVRPIVHYLLDKGYQVTVASRTKSKADAMIGGHPNGTAVAWTVEKEVELDEMVRTHDLSVSLLPYAHHVMVAKKCIAHKKDMVTTSYVKPEMKALDAEAREAGILILNELGVDPGIDHMSTMRIIDEVRAKGGKIEAFYSITGALVAPEVEKNPFNYKFTWAPKGVVMASNNDGRYLLNGKETYIPTEDYFKHPFRVNFPGVGLLESYPNRDSMPYIELYGIPEVQTMYRGTFRYEKWCEIMDAMKSLNLISYEEYDWSGMTYADFTARVSGVANPAIVKELVSKKLGVPEEANPIVAMEWLGLFSQQPVHLEKGSAFDITSDLMIEKMMIGDEERDMVAMQHTFVASYPDGHKEVIKSRLLDFGTPATDTSIARTVALPAACGVDMILQGQIDAKGVHIPVIPAIYNPILDQLETMGIRMEEEYGLPITTEIP